MDYPENNENFLKEAKVIEFAFDKEMDDEEGTWEEIDEWEEDDEYEHEMIENVQMMSEGKEPKDFITYLFHEDIKGSFESVFDSRVNPYGRLMAFFFCLLFLGGIVFSLGAVMIAIPIAILRRISKDFEWNLSLKRWFYGFVYFLVGACLSFVSIFSVRVGAYLLTSLFSIFKPKLKFYRECMQVFGKK